MTLQGSGTFPERLSALLGPKGFSHPIHRVELVATHVSWVLLTGEFAYKIKRPVQYDFVDMRSLTQRKYFCEQELLLNRRFAPDIYLGVCEIVMVGGEARMGGDGVAVEYAVQMRQFERAEELDRLLDSGQIAPAELEAFGADIAVIHAGLPTAGGNASAAEWLRIRALILRNLRETALAAITFGAREEIEGLEVAITQRLQELQICISRRRELNRVRECHGDLHTCNVVRQNTGLVAFDCMEFEPAFRWIDVAEDIALLLVDLEARGYAAHAHAFLSGYLARSGDYQVCRILDLYKAHRALVRAKVSALTATSGADADKRASYYSEFARLIRCARNCLTKRSPILLMMCGLSGSGKSWLGARLAQRLQLVHLRSDVERKRGTAVLVQSQLYSRDSTDAVYEQLTRHTDDVLSGGYGVVLDATFYKRSSRARLRKLSEKLGVRVWVVHCSAPLETLRARIKQRRDLARDPSDADDAVLDWQRAHFEPITSDEGIPVLEANTDDLEIVNKILKGVLHPYQNRTEPVST